MKDLLRRRHYVSEWLERPDHPEIIDSIVEFIDDVRSASPSPRPRPRPATLNPFEEDPREPSPYESAAAEVLAARAAESASVRLFRRLNLFDWTRIGIRLLEPEEVHEWVTEHRETPTRWVAVPAPGPGTDLEVPYPRPGSGMRHLLYEAPGASALGRGWATGWPIHAVPTTHGGVLEDLRQIAEGLDHRFGWGSAAATWVLTGTTPRWRRFRWRRVENEPSLASRLILEVDPTMRPEELAREYRRVRARFVQGPIKPQSEKHLTLAAFTARRPAESWESSRLRWNETHPAWPYTSARNFGRDCRAALRRVSEPGHRLKLGVAGAPESDESAVPPA